MSFPFDFCTLPQSVVETVLQTLPSQQKKVEEVAKKTAETIVELGINIATMGALKIATKAVAQSSSQKLMGSFQDLAQDYADFFQMLKDNPTETLVEFGKFLKDSYLGDVSTIDENTVWKGMTLFLAPGLLPLVPLGPALYFNDDWRCAASLATFAVFPDASCEPSVPSFDVSKEDVKDFLIDAATVAVPILGLL
jgi:hypothetical protein